MTLKIDTVTDLGARIERGRWISATREAMLKVSGGHTAWPALVNAAYNELVSGGYRPGASFGDPEPKLVVVDIDLKLERGQTSYVRATIGYRYEATTAQWRASVTTKEVNDAFKADGTPISVAYTYPADYATNPQLAGKTVTQGGQITTTKTIATQRATLVVQTNNPGELLIGWVNHLNEFRWNGKEPRTWKVTDGSVEEFDMTADPPKYELELEFSYDPDGWDPSAVFIDRETNEMPPDLDPTGSGVVTVEKLPERDFSKVPG